MANHWRWMVTSEGSPSWSSFRSTNSTRFSARGRLILGHALEGHEYERKPLNVEAESESRDSIDNKPSLCCCCCEFGVEAVNSRYSEGRLGEFVDVLILFLEFVDGVFELISRVKISFGFRMKEEEEDEEGGGFINPLVFSCPLVSLLSSFLFATTFLFWWASWCLPSSF